MERRNFIKGALLTASSAGLAACSTSTKKSADLSGKIMHSVYFWLKEGISTVEESDFLNFFEALKKVPGIDTLYYGKPAPTNPRPVVDNSFNYNLVVLFSKMEDLIIYEKHPDHLAASEKYNKYWRKVLVHDTQF